MPRRMFSTIGDNQMNPQARMSPFTAFFLGAFGLGGVAVACGTAVFLYSLRIVEVKAGDLIGFAEHTIADLPAIIERMPRAVGDLLDDRRAPDYAGRIGVEAAYVMDEARKTVRPTLTIANNGNEVVSLLSVRLATLDENRRPICEWTEVVATPLAIDDEWRGPLMPGATRHVLLASAHRCVGSIDPTKLQSAVEITDVRVWKPEGDQRTAMRVETP